MSENKKAARISLVLGGPKDFPVRASHLHAHEARLNTESGKMEYSTLALIPKGSADVKMVKDAIEKLKKETWLDQKKKVPPQFWNPFKDGDEDTKQDGSSFGEECKGHYLLNCNTDEAHPPKAVSMTRDEDGKYKKNAKSEIKTA